MEEPKLVIRERTTRVKFETIQKTESFWKFSNYQEGDDQNDVDCFSIKKFPTTRSHSICEMTEQINPLVKEKNLFQFQITSKLQALFERLTQSRF